jgi:hypothetical protein
MISLEKMERVAARRVIAGVKYEVGGVSANE